MTKDEVMTLFVDDVATRKKIVADYLQDKGNSFEDRKEVFLSTPRHLYRLDPWILHLPEFEKKHGEISWFDDFYVDRYVDVDLVSTCKELDDYKENWSAEKKSDFIAAVVNHGRHSFTMDW